MSQEEQLASLFGQLPDASDRLSLLTIARTFVALAQARSRVRAAADTGEPAPLADPLPTPDQAIA